MAGLSDFAVQRSLQSVAFKLGKDAQIKANEADLYGHAETLQNYQIEIKGQVGPTPWFDEITIPFAEPFYDVLGQRNSNLTEPHFTYGLVMDQPTVDFFDSVHVVDWDTNDQGDFIRATVRIGIYSPAIVHAVKFIGRIHVTFQGYSSPVDELPEDLGGLG